MATKRKAAATGKVAVTAPNRAFTGVVIGVAFKDGKATADREDDAAALGYFARQGYGIGDEKPAVPDDSTPRVDAREPASQPVGTPLRDAAVDPQPEDFLAPINAGEADPHGPEVVAPEIHHEGPKGIKPGDVHVDEPAKQERDEKALATKVLIEGEPKTSAVPAAATAEGAPAKSASKGAWRDYAVAAGMNPEEAEAASRAELIERYGGEG